MDSTMIGLVHTSLLTCVRIILGYNSMNEILDMIYTHTELYCYWHITVYSDYTNLYKGMEVTFAHVIASLHLFVPSKTFLTSVA